jgi:NAD(P)-dependent dehydrogenase (short-subunit alcohol dehydrogenase family)
MRLDGKAAVITGAGSGIGLATVHRFREEGASVLAADISAERLGQLAGLERVETIEVDVARREDVDRMIGTAVERLGRLDILFNNAGILDRFTPVAEVTDELWDRILAVDLTGPMMACRAAIPHMLAAGGGVIVNTSSVAGLTGARGGVAYTTAKHGLIGLTRHVATNYGRDGIRCIAICPGGVLTNIGVHDLHPRGEEAINRVVQASERWADPAEIAAVVAFLASDEASFVNGAAIVADGGWTAY